MGSSQFPRSFKHDKTFQKFWKSVCLHNAAMLTVVTYLRNEGRRQRISKSKESGINYQEFDADY